MDEFHVIGSLSVPLLYLGHAFGGCRRCVYCMFVARGDGVAVNSKISAITMDHANRGSSI
jgi:hypothetical protein